MRASQRVFVNTVAQYGRTIINMLLSLYTVRLVLATLGANDYGIYILVAGVVAMLAFITNSLVTTTQRYVSFYQGKGDTDKLRDVFNSSLVIHIIIGILVVLVLESITPLLFNGFLNIPNDRLDAAELVYQTVVVIILFSFSAAPYRALLISHENIVYISIIDVLDGILKVILVTILTKLSYDKLIWYGLFMLSVQIFNFFALSVYCYLKYEECVFPRFRRLSKEYMKGMLSFAGWSIYTTGCFVGRQQGIAIILNRMAGPVINAAYGIGFQVAGYTNFLSNSLINAINPQIVKAEGCGDRERALWLSNVTSKFIFFLLSAVCIPCMFELDAILDWWLEDVPNNASLFCTMVMVTLLCDALTLGCGYVIQAIGKIGLYSVIMNTPKLLTLPVSWIILKNGYPLYSIAIAYAGVELICSLLRLPFLKKQAGLDIKQFFKDVPLRELLPLAISIIVAYLCSRCLNFSYSFLLTFIITLFFYGLAIYALGLTVKEKEIVNGLAKSIYNKLRKK